MIVPREITIYEDGCNDTNNNYINLTYNFNNGIILHVIGNNFDELRDLASDKIIELYASELINFIIESPHITKDYINIDKCLEAYIMLSIGFYNEDRDDYGNNIEETRDDLIGDIMEFFDINTITFLYKGRESKYYEEEEDEDSPSDYQWDLETSNSSLGIYASIINGLDANTTLNMFTEEDNGEIYKIWTDILK